MAYVVQQINDLRSFKEMIFLEGKVAVITGAAGGIGRSTAAGLAEMGAKVALMDIPSAEEKLKQNVADIEARYGVEAMYVLGDVSDPDSVDNIIKTVVDRFGTIDILHNNAGVGLPDGPQMTYDLWCKEVGINLTGAFLMARGCAEVMKAHGHGGSVVTTASISGVVSNAGVCYGATKAGVNHMSNVLGIDYAKDNIRFNAVCYGYILSGMHEKMGGGDANRAQIDAFYDAMAAGTSMRRMAKLEEAVGVVIYLASDLASFQTASTMIVDGGVCVDRRRQGGGRRKEA